MATNARAKRKRETKYETKDWRWLLWDSDLARDKIHPELGAGWTAVLKEACCLRAGVHKDKVIRLRRKGDRGPLRLWPKKEMWRDRNDFKGMVPTVPLLEWCVRRKYKPDAKTFVETARGGDMDAIRWLRKKKCPWDGKIWDGEIGTNYHSNACIGAARGGHLDVLKWLRKEGCTWDEWTCWNAAWKGHLDVLKYAHENGCPWDEKTCSWAAGGGHLDVLEYAHKNGCPWDWTVTKAAEQRRHHHILDYLFEHRCPGTL